MAEKSCLKHFYKVSSNFTNVPNDKNPKTNWSKWDQFLRVTELINKLSWTLSPDLKQQHKLDRIWWQEVTWKSPYWPCCGKVCHFDLQVTSCPQILSRLSSLFICFRVGQVLLGLYPCSNLWEPVSWMLLCVTLYQPTSSQLHAASVPAGLLTQDVALHGSYGPCGLISIMMRTCEKQRVMLLKWGAFLWWPTSDACSYSPTGTGWDQMLPYGLD